MDLFRIESADERFADPETARSAFAVLSRAQMMGVDLPPRRRLDEQLFCELVRRLNDAGIGRALGVADANGGRASTAAWRERWAQLAEALEASPHPRGEWGPARAVLGDDLLGELVGVSAASLRRYASGARATPDGVAERLHEMGRIVAALAGSYNDYGVRRWLARPRGQLDGRAPREILRGAWSADDADVRRVVALAEALLGAGGAT